MIRTIFNFCILPANLPYSSTSTFYPHTHIPYNLTHCHKHNLLGELFLFRYANREKNSDCLRFIQIAN